MSRVEMAVEVDPQTANYITVSARHADDDPKMVSVMLPPGTLKAAELTSLRVDYVARHPPATHQALIDWITLPGGEAALEKMGSPLAAMLTSGVVLGDDPHIPLSARHCVIHYADD